MQFHCSLDFSLDKVKLSLRSQIGPDFNSSQGCWRSWAGQWPVYFISVNPQSFAERNLDNTSSSSQLLFIIIMLNCKITKVFLGIQKLLIWIPRIGKFPPFIESFQQISLPYIVTWHLLWFWGDWISAVEGLLFLSSELYIIYK